MVRVNLQQLMGEEKVRNEAWDDLNEKFAELLLLERKGYTNLGLNVVKNFFQKYEEHFQALLELLLDTPDLSFVKIDDRLTWIKATSARINAHGVVNACEKFQKMLEHRKSVEKKKQHIEFRKQYEEQKDEFQQEEAPPKYDEEFNSICKELSSIDDELSSLLHVMKEEWSQVNCKLEAMLEVNKSCVGSWRKFQGSGEVDNTEIDLQKLFSEQLESLHAEGFLDYDQFQQLKQAQKKRDFGSVVEIMKQLCQDSDKYLDRVTEALEKADNNMERIAVLVSNACASSRGCLGGGRLEKLQQERGNLRGDLNADEWEAYIQLAKEECLLMKTKFGILYELEEQIVAAGGYD